MILRFHVSCRDSTYTQYSKLVGDNQNRIYTTPHASYPFCILTFKEFEKIYCSMARDDIDVNLPGPSGAQMVPLQTCQFTILEGAGRSTLEVTHHKTNGCSFWMMLNPLVKSWCFGKPTYKKMLVGLWTSRVYYSSIWGFPKVVVPPKHPNFFFSRKTHGCWVPPFWETPIYLKL